MLTPLCCQLSGFQLSGPQLDMLMQLADVNNDGVVSYEEFIPAARQLLQARTAPSPYLADMQKAFVPEYLKYV